MKQSILLKRVLTTIAFVILLYTFVGFFLAIGIRIDSFNQAERVDIWRDPGSLGVLMVVTGIPLFLLFLFILRRINKH